MIPRFIGMLILVSLGLASPAFAQEQALAAPEPDAELPRLGMATGEPQTRSAPPSIPFGVPPVSREYVLDFHGYMLVPARLGLHRRENPTVGQSGTVLHSPPLTPENYRRFQYTAALPEPWVHSTRVGMPLRSSRAPTRCGRPSRPDFALARRA